MKNETEVKAETSVQEEKLTLLMPTFNQAPFISRAIDSLLHQTVDDWQLIIIDDGSTDQTGELLQPYLVDQRIHYHRLATNQGLGVALNYGLDLVTTQFIAYLPSDDIYFSDHLASLRALLLQHPDAVLAYAGMKHEVRVPGQSAHSAPELKKPYPLQLVQVMHRATRERWIERKELVTDDLERMFWTKLRPYGCFIGTERVTCQWVDHPHQRHKVIQEPSGGINPYRIRYHVRHPLRFHSSTGSLIDEVERFRCFRQPQTVPQATNGLKILLVGELAFNPERILALEERGHKLYGLWTPDTHWLNTVGPLPFGHVEDIPYNRWRESVRKLKPDLIYALLNWITVPFAHKILSHNPGVPFIWHFKEGPFDCLANGTWSQLIDLYTRSDGQIFLNQETRDWFARTVPGIDEQRCVLVLDGDLPKREWFTDEQAPSLSEQDGKIHTVIPGGLHGFSPVFIGQLARQNIHLHFYGDFYRNFYHNIVEEALQVAPEHLHMHQQVEQSQWVTEFSQYDAGWLHIHQSDNAGDLHRASWEDLNYPARLSTLAAAGLPSIQYDNSGSIVATQTLAQTLGTGIFFTDAEELATQLQDQARLRRLRQQTWLQREQFTFDYHADKLLAFFQQVINSKQA